MYAYKYGYIYSLLTAPTSHAPVAKTTSSKAQIWFLNIIFHYRNLSFLDKWPMPG